MEVAGRSTTGGLPMPQKKRKKLLKLVDGFSSMSAFLPSTTSTHTPHTKRVRLRTVMLNVCVMCK